MPRVQEYLPEQEAQGPVGQTSPMLEQVAMYGRGMETASREVGDAFNVLHQRETQAETSNAYADVAEQRANFHDRIAQETNDGTLDVEKIKQDYQDWTDKKYEDYNTPGGKDAFVRASARAGGSLLSTAVRGKSIVMGNEARENLTTLSTSNSNLVQKDPSQFSDLRDASTEALHSQVESGALTQPVARQIQMAMDVELSKGAIRGYMETDYNNIKNAVVSSGDKVDPNEPHLNVADRMLKAGAFDQFLNSDEKKKMEQEIRSNQVAAQVAGKQAVMQRQNAVSASGELFKVKSYEKLQSQSLTPDEVTKAAKSGLISSDEQLKMYHLIDQAGKAETGSMPAVVNDLRQRILSPDNDPKHISDPMQMANMVGAGISHKDFQDLTATLKMVPANRVNSFNEAELLKVARQRIGKGPDSEYRNLMFSNAVDQAKRNAMKEGKSMGALFDPTNQQEWLGKLIPSYVPSARENLRQQAEHARGNVLSPATVDTQPGVTPTPQSSFMDRMNAATNRANETANQASKPGAPAAKKWGSSLSDYGDAARSAADWAKGIDLNAMVNRANSAAGNAANSAARAGSGGASATAKVEDIVGMNLAQLKKLDPAALSPSQRAAAKARWNALNGGKK